MTPLPKGAVGFQRWDSLLFLHWTISTETVRKKIPQRLSVDLFNGRAYLTFASFTVQNAHLRGLPLLALLSNFHELNVRTYVRFGKQPGVWFFSLDAQSTLAVILARMSFGLPYFKATIERAFDGERFSYRSARRSSSAAFEVSWRIGSEVRLAATDTLEHFLTERYCLYSQGPANRLWQVPVQHSPWPLQTVFDLNLKQTVDVADDLASAATGEPIANYSKGVDVSFMRPRLI